VNDTHDVPRQITPYSLCTKLCVKATANIAQQMKKDGSVTTERMMDYPELDKPCPSLDGRECNNHGDCVRSKCQCHENYTYTDVCLPIPAPTITVRGKIGDPFMIQDKFTINMTCNKVTKMCTAEKVCNGKGTPQVGGWCDCPDLRYSGVDPVTGKSNCGMLPIDDGNVDDSAPGWLGDAGTFRHSRMGFGCLKPPGCFGPNPKHPKKCGAAFATGEMQGQPMDAENTTKVWLPKVAHARVHGAFLQQTKQVTLYRC